MLKWFKRRPPARPAVAPAPGDRPAAVPRRVAPPTDPMPLPEIVGEGNTQADWNAWEDSMTSFNSQLPELETDSGFYVRTRPTQLDEPDAFEGVRRKRGDR